jgi:hypothetical protein
VKERAVDNHGSTGDFSQAVPFPVVATPLPVVNFVSPGATTLNVDISGTVTQAFVISATNPRAGNPGVTDPIPVGNITFLPNDAGATITNSVSNGGGNYTFTVRYLGAIAAGTRTATPTAYATDSVGIQGLPASGPLMTLKTLGANRAPSIALTTPATDNTVAWTSKPFSLGFTLNDADNDPVVYTINWGDGQPTTSGSPVGDFVAGVPVTIDHVYADAFTAGSTGVTITVTATDNRSTNSNAVPKTRLVTVKFNTPPMARIDTPQVNSKEPTGLQAGITPPYVVVPNGGRLTFAGTSTRPASQDAVTTTWTFPEGTPSSASGDTPGDIIFSGTQGVITPVTVVYTVTDAFGRTATASDQVLVDGKNTQQFNLSFQYRLKNDNGTSSLSPVTLPANGLGAQIQIFQDGLSNTYSVQDQGSGGNAQVSIPVRSDLPFQFKMPEAVAAAAGDSINYMMQIPNKPGVDSALGTTLLPNASSFGFVNTDPAASAAPWWTPTLQIVTAQGFAPEALQARERKFQGTVYVNGSSPLNMVLGSTLMNDRWFDRLSIPLLSGDSLGAIQAETSNSSGAIFTGLRATQLFAEWPIYLMTRMVKDISPAESPKDTTSAAAASADLGFVLDMTKFTGDGAVSASFAAFNMQAWRIPAAVTDPYDLTLAGWDDSSVTVQLNPTELGASVQNSFAHMLKDSPGTTSLSGGIQGLPIPYDFNDANWTPKGYAFESSNVLNFLPIRNTFSYAEYLWASVWARPMVLNRTSVDYTNTTNLTPWFRNSQPATWPTHTGITPGNGAFNMVTSGVGAFDASSPGVDGGLPASPTGVGRFYWTAYTPFYTSASGTAIARTWLGLNAGAQLPRTDYSAITDASAVGTDAVFSGSNLVTPGIPGTIGNPVAKIGFVPPPEVIVDKRTVVSGVPQDGTVGGYRVRWFNATKDAHGNIVPPDFWVVEFTVGAKTYHYMLPSNYPAGTQKVTDPVVTDARLYLPSTCIPYDPSAGTPANSTQGPRAGDLVAPGYCWFDVPAELRADIQVPSATCAVTVFAVKAFLNNPAVSARPLQRPDWIDAIKTATANIKIDAGRPPASKGDMQYVYKVPFNYAWDIVIANSPCTLVAP